MKTRQILICTCMGFALAGSAYATKLKTLSEWELCRDKAESSVNQFEVGVSGVEAEINEKCGEPPAKEPSPLTGAVGMHPYDLVRSNAWKSHFTKITQESYQGFVERLTVAGETVLEGEWVVGEGIAPHMGGSDEAAFAINTKTGEVFAAMMEDGKKFTKFGFNAWENAPPHLQEWFNSHKQ